MDISKAKAKYPEAETFSFGNSKKLCDKLTLLVVSGKKTTTCAALSFYLSGKEKMPSAGRIYIATNWDGTPAVAIKIVEVEIKRFNEVREGFALDEGENNDLEGWQKDHREYFEQNGEFEPQMKLVCERFEVVEVFT